MGNKVSNHLKEEEFKGFLNFSDGLFGNLLNQKEIKPTKIDKKDKSKGKDTFTKSLTSHLEKELNVKIGNNIEIKPPETKLGALYLFDEFINYSNSFIENEKFLEHSKIYLDSILNNNYNFYQLCYDFLENGDNQEHDSRKNFDFIQFDIDKFLIMNEVNKANFSEEVFNIIFGENKGFFHNAMVFIENIKYFFAQVMPDDNTFKVTPFLNDDLLFNIILTQLITSSASYNVVKYITHIHLSFYVDVDNEIETKTSNLNNNLSYNCLNLLILNHLLKKCAKIKKINITFIEHHKFSKKFSLRNNFLFNEKFNNFCNENENSFKSLNKHILSMINYLFNSVYNIAVNTKMAQMSSYYVRYPSNIIINFLKDKSNFTSIVNLIQQVCSDANKNLFYTLNIYDIKKDNENILDFVKYFTNYKEHLISLPKILFFNEFSFYIEKLHFIVKREADNFLFNFKNNLNELKDLKELSSEDKDKDLLKEYSEHLIDVIKDYIILSKHSIISVDLYLHSLFMSSKFSTVNFFNKIKLNNQLEYYLENQKLIMSLPDNKFHTNILFLFNNTSNPNLNNFSYDFQNVINKNYECFSLYTHSNEISNPSDELVGLPINELGNNKLYILYMSLNTKLLFTSNLCSPCSEDKKQSIIDTVNQFIENYSTFLLMNSEFIKDVLPDVLIYFLKRNLDVVDDLKNTLKIYIRDPLKYDLLFIMSINPKDHKYQAYFKVSFYHDCKVIESLLGLISLFENIVSSYKDIITINSIKIELVTYSKKIPNMTNPLLEIIIQESNSKINFNILKHKNYNYLTLLIKSLLFHLSLHFPVNFEKLSLNLNEIISTDLNFLSIIKDMKIKSLTIKDEHMSNSLLIKYQKNNLVSHFPPNSKIILELTINNSLLETLEFIHDNNISYDALKLQLKSISISSISQEKLEKYRENLKYLAGYRMKRKEMIILYFYMGLYEMFNKENSYFKNFLDFFKLFFDNIIINAKEEDIKFNDKLALFEDKFTSDCDPYALYYCFSKAFKGKMNKVIYMNILSMLVRKRVIKVEA